MANPRPSLQRRDRERAAEILREAVLHLNLYGWCRGRFGEVGGPCCALGALENQSTYPHMGDPRYKRLAVITLAQVIEKETGFSGGLPLIGQTKYARARHYLVDWNDSACQDKKQLIRYMEQAADIIAETL